ncbi:MAG: 23S rRNA (cytosine(1962)-C(5))-methyltransferase RlmI, partial [Lentisphaerae bacterium]|nr:23S rRNA (cytosine(1962)-C(5))-methyltransferase RlmI [Lentisphaerota bacterium]
AATGAMAFCPLKLTALPPSVGLLAGAEPADRVEIVEGACRFEVDVRAGHKTGFYLDQRPSRQRVSECVSGAEVLNCFSYSGAFGVWALKGGAKRLVNIDTSAPALQQAERHLALNGYEDADADHVVGDVFHELRRFRDSRATFDTIVLDPPKFAASREHVAKASRGYKDINRLAMLLLRPGGLLFTFSCSGHVTPDFFQKIVADAAIDAGRDAQILDRLGCAADHPVLATFPEGHYLKGLMLRVS